VDYHNPSPHSWSSEIKYVMTELQLLNNFENKSAVDLNCAKLNAYGIHSKSWIQTVQSSPKLRTYKLFKNTFETENYIELNLTKHERSVLAQFRCGILSFLFCFISSLNIYRSTLLHKNRIYVSVKLHNSLTIINDGTLNMVFKYAVNIVEGKNV